MFLSDIFKISETTDGKYRFTERKGMQAGRQAGRKEGRKRHTDRQTERQPQRDKEKKGRKQTNKQKDIKNYKLQKYRSLSCFVWINEVSKLFIKVSK